MLLVPTAFNCVVVANVIRGSYKITVRLIFFSHLVYKICSLADRMRSCHYKLSYLPIPGIQLHKHLWGKSLINIAANKCDCKYCHCNSKNIHKYASAIILQLYLDEILFFMNFFKHILLWPKWALILPVFSKCNILSFTKKHRMKFATVPFYSNTFSSEFYSI